MGPGTDSRRSGRSALRLFVFAAVVLHGMTGAFSILGDTASAQSDPSGMSYSNALFQEMLEQGIDELAFHFEEYPPEQGVLFAGIAVLPDQGRDLPLKKAVTHFMATRNIFGMLVERGVNTPFYDAENAGINNHPLLDGPEDSTSYADFMQRAFLRPDARFETRRGLPCATRFPLNGLRNDKLVYGYLLYNETDSRWSPSRLFLILKVCSIDSLPQSDILFPRLDRVVMVERSIGSSDVVEREPVQDEEARNTLWDLLRNRLRGEGDRVEEAVPLADPTPNARVFESYLPSQEALSSMMAGETGVWGVLPQSAMETPWKTVFLLDALQRMVSKHRIDLVDTSLLRKFLYDERNQSLQPREAHVRALIKNLLSHAVLSNVDLDGARCFQSAYTVKSRRNDEPNVYWVEDVSWKDVDPESPSTHLEKIAGTISERIKTVELLERFEGAGGAVRFDVVNSRGLWPKSPAESDIVQSVKLRVLKRLLSREFRNIESPLGGSRKREGVLIELTLHSEPQAGKGWESVVASQEPDSGFMILVRLSVDYKGLLIDGRGRKTEYITLKMAESEFRVDDRESVAAYVRNRLSGELEAGIAQSQRLYKAGRYAECIANQKNLEERIRTLLDCYDPLFSQGFQNDAIRRLEQYRFPEGMKAYQEWMRRAEIATIFLEDPGWYERAAECYERATQIAEEMENEQFSASAKEGSRDIQGLRTWMSFRSHYRKGQRARERADWEDARSRFSSAKELSKEIDWMDSGSIKARIESSKKYQQRTFVLKAVDTMLEVEELYSDASSMENRSSNPEDMREAFMLYSKANNLLESIDVSDSDILDKIREGMERTGDKF